MNKINFSNQSFPAQVVSEGIAIGKILIIGNKTFPIMITFSASYLIRFPENKKYSWEDLKKIKQKIHELNIKI